MDDPIVTMCLRKQAFSSREEAQSELDRLLKTKGAEEAALMEVYKCTYCSEFHFGHLPKDHYRRKINTLSPPPLY